MDSSSTELELSAQVMDSSSSTISSSPSHYQEEDYSLINRRLRRESCESELTLNCTALSLILYLFGSMFLLMDPYGPKSLSIGPNSSILVESSSIFVESIKVKELVTKPGLKLYGFSKPPQLDVFANWSECRVFSVSQNSHKGWPYYLNKGTSLNISYNVKPQGSSVQLVVNEGTLGISQWLLNDPAYHDTYWSQNLLQGSGVIEFDISTSSGYYFSVVNLKTNDIKVELGIDVKAVLYNTENSFFNCTFSNGECTFDALSIVGSSVFVTSPALSQGVSIEDEWHVMLSYQPRWVGYVIGTVMVICYILVAIHLWKSLECCVGEGRHVPESDHSARRTLLEDKDEYSSSMGSCNESFASDDADLQEFMGNDGEGTRGLCAICCDAPRDCFFLPCGHSVSCYQCGKKMEEADVSCPICRRDMKVKRIYIA